MTYTDDEILQLQSEAQVSIDERRNKYGRIGLPSPVGFYIPVVERGKRILSVTLEDSTVILADSSRVLPVPGAKVRLRVESGKWVIKGADDREALSSSGGSTISTAKHQHNIGSPPGLFYPVDPASMNDGMLLPTGNGLEVTVGRVTYPKIDGTIGIYDSNGTLDFASAVSGLATGEGRWAITYILKTDGSVNYHIAIKTSAPLDTTTDLENAIADCLSAVSDAYPYHAVRISVGLATFGTYKAMTGRSMDSKDFIRLGFTSGGGASAETAIDKIMTDANGAIMVDANGNVMYGA